MKVGMNTCIDLLHFFLYKVKSLISKELYKIILLVRLIEYDADGEQNPHTTSLYD